MDVGIQRIWTYIGRKQNKVVKWANTRPMLYLCKMEEDPKGGGKPRWRWWYQVVPIDWRDEEWKVGMMVKGG